MRSLSVFIFGLVAALTFYVHHLEERIDLLDKCIDAQNKALANAVDFEEKQQTINAHFMKENITP
jgi:hypothetical protein